MQKKTKKTKRAGKEPSPYSGVVIREMELDDLPAIYMLGEKLFTAEKLQNLYRTWDEYELVDLFASDGEFCLVAEQKATIIGFALGTLIEKRRSAWSYGWLLWLGVEHEARGYGIGKRLLNRLTEKFLEHGARIMMLDTAAENIEALAFFRELGFGQDASHVYLSRNLMSHPDYIRRKKNNICAQAHKRKNIIKTKVLTSRVDMAYKESRHKR